MTHSPFTELARDEEVDVLAEDINTGQRKGGGYRNGKSNSLLHLLRFSLIFLRNSAITLSVSESWLVIRIEGVVDFEARDESNSSEVLEMVGVVGRVEEGVLELVSLTLELISPSSLFSKCCLLDCCCSFL